MEWDSNQVTADTTYTMWPSSQSTVSVINDQSGYAPSTLPDFKMDLDTSSPGTLVRTIPGKVIMDELGDKYAEHFRMSKANTWYKEYCHWWNLDQTEEYQTAQKASLFSSSSGSFYNYNYTAYNEFNNVYPITIHDLSFDITSLTYDFGYGKLSAGHIDPAKGKKQFGVLGQDAAISTGTYKGASDNWNYSNTTGLHHFSVTFLPVTDKTVTGTTTQCTGSIYWDSFSNFTMDLSSFNAVKDCELVDIGYPTEAARNAVKLVAAVAMFIITY